jgi:hypothetical protein
MKPKALFIISLCCVTTVLFLREHAATRVISAPSRVDYPNAHQEYPHPNIKNGSPVLPVAVISQVLLFPASEIFEQTPYEPSNWSTVLFTGLFETVTAFSLLLITQRSRKRTPTRVICITLWAIYGFIVVAAAAKVMLIH